MVERTIVMFLATALIALPTGCSTRESGTIAGLATASDASPSATQSKLDGTWRGWFVQTGSDGHVDGDVTLLIKDDATYRMISKRRGRGDIGGASNESGVVVSNGRSVTLKSSSGQWTSLVRKGDTLYGVIKGSSGHTLQISVERTSGVVEAP